MSELQSSVLKLRLQNKGIKEIAAIIGKTYSQTNAVLQKLRLSGAKIGYISKRKFDYSDKPNDIDGDVEKGLRCPNCWILFPADCTPGRCMARTNVWEHLKSIDLMLKAERHYAEMYKWP